MEGAQFKLVCSLPIFFTKIEDFMVRRTDQLFRNWRAHGCILCGERERCCIDAHHLDPHDKDLSISRMIRNRAPFERILTELTKCVPVCANCHRKIHAGLITLGEKLRVGNSTLVPQDI